MIKKLIITIIALTVILLTLAGVLVYRELDARKLPKILTQSPTPVISITEIPTPTPTPVIALRPAPTISPEIPAPTPMLTPTASDSAITLEAIEYEFGSITISDKNFEIKSGIDEATLKKNIGWMTTSAGLGEDGVCILMGHRNTQLRILKDIKNGDTINVTNSEGEAFSYTVSSAKVVKANEPLVFPSHEGKVLMIVTCYPFYYEGHAPDKFVLTARKK